MDITSKSENELLSELVDLTKKFNFDIEHFTLDYDELMDIIKECQKVAVRAGAESVSAYVKIIYRPEGEVLTIEKKVTKHHQ